MYVDLTADGGEGLAERLAATQVADEELGLAAVREWQAKFGEPYGMVEPSHEVPEGHEVVGAVGMQRLVVKSGDELSLDAVVWPFPMFAPDWADGFRLGTLFARFYVVLTPEAKARFVGEVPEP